MILLSFLALVLSVLLLLNRIRNKFYRLLFTIFTTISFLLISVYQISDMLTHNGFDESILFHIKMGLAGASLSDFWQIILYGCFLVFIIIIMAMYVYKKTHTNSQEKANFFIVLLAMTLLFFSYASNQIINDIRHIFIYDSNDNFYNYYRLPTITSKQQMKKKNIVYIYAESLERTYMDETLFPGLIVDLKKLEKKSLSFHNIFQLNTTGWTIAGMTASQCAIPLVTPFDSGGNSMSGITDSFLPSAKCMGDLLKDEGYSLEYFGGSSLEFAGKGNFYKSHSFSKVMGKNELKKLLPDPSYMTGWGLYDDSLLDIAYDEFELLSVNDQPFGLFMLTLDTHHPRGHSSITCKEMGIRYQDGTNSMLNAVKCSDFLLSRFINKILASSYAENTIIVLTSDHLAMQNFAYEELEKGKRRDLFMIIDGAKTSQSQQIIKKGTMLDIAPTVMNVLGFSVEMGLGRNLFTESSLVNISNHADKLFKENEKLYEKLENKKISMLNVISLNTILYSWRDYFLSFWSFPKLEKGLKIATKQKNITINKKVMKYPVVLHIDKDTTVFPKFSFFEKGKMKNIINKIPAEDAFIWVDYCSYMNKTVNVKNSTKEVCFAIGNTKNDYMYITKVKDNLELSGETIISFINNNPTGYDTADFIKTKPSLILDTLDTNKIFSERCHSKDLNPEDIINNHILDDEIILISAYHVDNKLVSQKFINYMNKENSDFVSLKYEDLYLGIIKNKKLIIEKSNCRKQLDLEYKVDLNEIKIKTTGLDSLFKSSIIINGVEVSPNYSGINLVVFNSKTGDTQSYNFPTYQEEI